MPHGECLGPASDEEHKSFLGDARIESAPEKLALFFSLGLLILYLLIHLLAVSVEGIEFFRKPEFLLPAVLSVLLPAAISRSRHAAHAGTALVLGMQAYIAYMSIALPDLVDPIIYFLAICFPLILAPPLHIRPGTTMMLTAVLAGYMGLYAVFMDIPNPVLAVFPIIFCIMTGFAVWYLEMNTTRSREREEILSRSLNRLYQFALGWSQTPDFDTALETALEILVDAFSDSRIAIMLPDELEKELIIRTSAGYPFELESNLSIPSDSGLTGWAFQHGEVVRAADVSEDSRYVELDPTVQSEMCVPMRAGERAVGIINLESTERSAYSRDDEQFLETMAPLLASFIINARLQQEAGFLSDMNQTLLETAPAGMITYSFSGECLYVNQAMVDILGEQLATVLSKNLYDIDHWKTIGLADKAREAFRTSAMQKIEAGTLNRKREKIIEYYLQPFSIQSEPHLLVMAVDNTQQAHMQLDLEEERNFISTVLENASALVMVVGADGTIRRFNAACENLAGIPAEEAVGRHIYDVMKVPPEEALSLQEIIALGEGENLIELVSPWYLKDGTIRTISWSDKLVMDEQGEVDFLVAVGNDITEEQALTSQLRLQSEALNSAANGIVITDIDGNIEWVNPAVTRLTGYSREELLGENPRVLKSGEHPDEFYAELWDTITAGNVWNGRLINKRKDSSTYHEDMTITPVCDDEGQIQHFIAIKRDVSEQYAMEKALRESEARFRAFITGASVGLFVGSAEGRIIEVNPALAVMLGYSVEELSHLNINNLVHPEDEEESASAYQSLFEGSREQLYIRVRIIRKNGQLLWARASLGLIRDAEGDPLYAIGILEDVTEHHWAEEALFQSEQRLEQITNSVDQCIYSFSITRHGELIAPLITPSISKFTGYGVEEHLANPDLWLDAIHPDDRDHIEVKYSPHKADTERMFLNYRVLDREGRVHWIKDDIFFELDNSGNPIRMDGVLTDITDLKKAQGALEEQIEKVEKANVRLRELDRLKSNFLANISHELRTPLNSIIGFAELMVDGLAGGLNDQQQEFMEDIHSSGKHLLALINDILDLSKIEAGRLDVHPQPVDIEKLVEETVSSIIHQFERKNQILHIEVQKDLPEVNADRIRIKQVLLNLLSNANKFTLEGGEVRLQAAMLDRSALMVSVVDTGIGIAEEDYESVFEEFQQVDSSATREAQGTGLGIPISRKIVEMHGGRMWMESELGEGTTFTFILPFTGPKSPLLIGETLEDFDSGKEDQPIVLIVEDDRNYANILSFHFNLEGFEILHVSRGRDAFEQALEHKPCMITLDLMLPDKDGWELLSELKTNEETVDIPVVVLSALDEAEAGWGRWREQGAAAYLVKPVQHEDILQLLDQFDLNLHPRKIVLFEDQTGYRELMQGMEGCLKLDVETISPAAGDEDDSVWEEIDMFLLLPEASSSHWERLEEWKNTFREHRIPIVAVAFSEGADLEGYQDIVDETAAASPESPVLFQKALMTAYNSALQRMREAS